MTYLQLAKIGGLILIGLLIGSISVWFYKDHQIQEMELVAAAEKAAIQETLINRYVSALNSSKELKKTNEQNVAKIQEELDFALDQNDDLRRDIRSISVRVKTPRCPAVGVGGGDTAGAETVQLEVADDLRQDLFDLREAIIRDQSALKERDLWIEEISKYSICSSPPSS